MRLEQSSPIDSVPYVGALFSCNDSRFFSFQFPGKPGSHRQRLNCYETVIGGTLVLTCTQTTKCHWKRHTAVHTGPNLEPFRYKYPPTKQCVSDLATQTHTAVCFGSVRFWDRRARSIIHPLRSVFHPLLPLWKQNSWPATFSADCTGHPLPP